MFCLLKKFVIKLFRRTYILYKMAEIIDGLNDDLDDLLNQP